MEPHEMPHPPPTWGHLIVESLDVALDQFDFDQHLRGIVELCAPAPLHPVEVIRLTIAVDARGFVAAVRRKSSATPADSAVGACIERLALAAHFEFRAGSPARLGFATVAINYAVPVPDVAVDRRPE